MSGATAVFTSLAACWIQIYYLRYKGDSFYSSFGRISTLPTYMPGVGVFHFYSISSESGVTILAYVNSALRITYAETGSGAPILPIASVQKTTDGQTANGYLLDPGVYAIIGAINSTTTEIIDRFAKGDRMEFRIGHIDLRVPAP